MSGANRVAVASCWACLLLSALLCEPALAKGGRGGSRGSSRGSHSRGRAGVKGGSRSRLRAAGRTSPVRVASAAAAGAAVALTAEKWYASAFRRGRADSAEDGTDYSNGTNYFDALMSGSGRNGSSLCGLVSIILSIITIILATLSSRYGPLLDSILQTL